MNLKPLIAAAAIALAPLASFASTIINVDANGVTDSGAHSYVNDDLNGFDLNITSTSIETASVAFLSSTVIEFSANTTGTVTVEVIDDYTLGGTPLGFLTNASVSQPATGGVTVDHYVSFDGGLTETQLANFVFGTSAGSAQDFDVLPSDGTFRLRSFYTIVATETSDIINVNGDITASPVPVPAGILLMGTAIAGFGVMRGRRRKKTS